MALKKDLCAVLGFADHHVMHLQQGIEQHSSERRHKATQRQTTSSELNQEGAAKALKAEHKSRQQ